MPHKGTGHMALVRESCFTAHLNQWISACNQSSRKSHSLLKNVGVRCCARCVRKSSKELKSTRICQGRHLLKGVRQLRRQIDLPLHLIDAGWNYLLPGTLCAVMPESMNDCTQKTFFAVSWIRAALCECTEQA